jgi:dephospho-CoA kinase
LRIIGLTGGIASGKSTVARMFAALGAPIVDADLLAREVVEPGHPALQEIAARWPSVVVGGVLDRKALAATIFGNEAERRALNAITHPRIAEASMARMQALAATGARAAIYEAALIVENNLDRGMDGLVVVSLPPPEQQQRLMQRDGLTPAQAEARLSAQASLAEKVKRATWVVDNGGTLQQTQAQVEQVWRSILEGA